MVHVIAILQFHSHPPLISYEDRMAKFINTAQKIIIVVKQSIHETVQVHLPIRYPNRKLERFPSGPENYRFEGHQYEENHRIGTGSARGKN